MSEQSRNPVVPPLNNQESGDVQNAVSQIISTNLSPEFAGKSYISIDDFKVDLQQVPKLWKSRDKVIMVKPMTKGDRDSVLKPINGQKIEAGADGSTKGFFISLDLFDEIKKGVIVRSLSHYTRPDGKPAITRETLEAMDNASYEELSVICLSVNKIDFFEANASDVAAADQAKNS